MYQIVCLEYVQLIICQLDLKRAIKINLSWQTVTFGVNLAYSLQAKNGFYVLKIIKRKAKSKRIWDRPCMFPQSLKCLLSVPLQRKFANPWMRTIITHLCSLEPHGLTTMGSQGAAPR